MGKFGNNNRKSYLRRLIALTFVFGILLPSGTVFAGSLNAEEARLIRSVSITYEYEGKSYRVKDEYLGKLRAYLMQDDVDLSAQEVNELIPQAMSNVATGVTDGYLMEIPKKEDLPQEKITESEDTKTTTEISQEGTDKDNNTEEDAEKPQKLSDNKEGHPGTEISKKLRRSRNNTNY